ncbi:MAG: hypothetical protein K1X88_25985 [Nannocystaceae bacterium]|nr:hypothetical protein [Nannocystaceae bacterium]
MAIPSDPAALPLPLARDPHCADHVMGTLVARWGPLDDATRRDAASLHATALAVPRPVLFVAVHHGNFPSLEGLAPGLAAAGFTPLAVYLHGDPPAQVFARAWSCGGSLSRFAALVDALPPDTPIYLQAHARWIWLGPLVAALRPGAPLVQEVWDWMSAFVDPSQSDAFVADGVFTAAELATMRRVEPWVRTATSGFVHKHGGPALDAVVADATVPQLRFVPALPRAWAHAPGGREVGPWRLVHVGQIKSAAASPRAFGDLVLAPLFHDLTRQGMYVTAHPGVTGAGAHDPLADYTALARRDHAFTLHAHLPLRRLVDALAGQHDFGLLLYRFPATLAVGRTHLRIALASKLFTYLAAGLPVLVSPELETMATLVREHGVGLVIEPEALPRLRSTLDGCDLRGMQRAVAAAQSHFHNQAFVDDVAALLDRVAPASRP